MRINRAFPFVAAALMFAACSSSSNKTNTPDARNITTADAPSSTFDAPVSSVDAPAANAGLTCSVSGSTVSGCDDLSGKSGVTCVYGSNMEGFCTTACDSKAAVTANAQGTDFTPADYTAAETKGDATCTALYGSNAPSAQVHCELPLNITPAPNSDGSLTANGKYTVDFYCAIECGATGQAACPTGMVCNQGLCDHS